MTERCGIMLYCVLLRHVYVGDRSTQDTENLIDVKHTELYARPSLVDRDAENKRGILSGRY